jgi:hypothetical protein
MFFPLQCRPLGCSVLREIISLSAHFQFWYPLDLKVEAKTVQGILRHEDFGTTMQLYAQSDMEAMREVQASSWSSYWATGLPLVIIDATTPRRQRPAQSLDLLYNRHPLAAPCPHAIPIDLPRPAQTRAASFWRLYRTRGQRSCLHTL